MNTQETSRILDAVAKDFISDVDLLPQIAARFERKTFMKSLRARPALLILFVLLALGLLSGVVYALSRSLGYIPGVGLVDQSAAMRVLIEPVSVERDGIKLTVSEAVLSSDKSVLLYTLENVPWSALSHDERVGGCLSTPELHLPDGEVLHIKEGGGTMTDYRFAYAAIPGGVQDVSFVLPCIMNTLPGLAPENWVLPLHFKPAPADMTVVPVIEILATPTESQPVITPAATEDLPVTLTSALKIDDSYVLTGTLKRPGPASAIQIHGLRVTDASGAQVFTEIPQIPGLPNFDWGAQFKAETVSFPVTLTFTGVQTSTLTDSSAEFEFDAGQHPQPGQVWTPNQPIQIGGRTIKLETVRTDSRSGYSFEFSIPPDVYGFSLEIVDQPADGGGGGGDNQGKFSVGLAFSKLPTGKLKIRLSNMGVTGPKQTWKLQWSPENPPAAASLYGISLHVDQFITLADGYYLVGHTEWTDGRIQSINPPGDMQVSDASGQAVALEDANGQVAGLAQADNQWVYKIYGKVFHGPLTLHVSQLGLTFKDPARFSLDLRPYNFSFSDDKIGIPYKTGLIPLAVPGLTVNVGSAAYMKSGAERGFRFSFDADPRLQMLGFRIENSPGGSRGNSSYRDEQTGLLISEVTSDAPMTFPVVFAVLEAQISGDWTVSWTPPAGPMP
jgi:hypothetical protein